MRITLEVSGPDGRDTGAETLDLREWLRGEPALRDRVGRAPTPVPEPGAMGGLGELVALLLEPGGLTVTLAAGVVAWLQTRRGSQTVTITRPDGTQVVVTSDGVRGLTPESSGDVAERVARALEAGPARPAPGPAPAPEPGPVPGPAPAPELPGDPGDAGPTDPTDRTGPTDSAGPAAPTAPDGR
ncbi:hypothetical protein [Streptomyces sp. NPDC090025]|uniref:effector-associated constant component EACC1 n=1 Tax=Streptomyces sp. NPDC090025 TaxID=3365922 RepID=UPI0038350DE8